MTGALFGLGVGPGDPELLTLRTVRLLKSAQVVAYLAAKGRKGRALTTVEPYLTSDQTLIPMIYPVTTESLPSMQEYENRIRDFYDQSARSLAEHLEAGRNVAVLCEGDPFFYGSFMYFYDRLADHFETTVVPGVTSVNACAAALGTPLVYRNQTLTVISGVLPEGDLRTRLESSEAVAIMKLGTNFAKVRRVISELGLLDRAMYAERATLADQRVAPLTAIGESETVPYFSMIIIPGLPWVAS